MLEPIALYARISTNGNRQFLENQLAAVRRFTSGKPWKVVKTITDTVPGIEAPGWKQIKQLADAGTIKAVVVYNLEIITKRGPGHAFRELDQLASKGCHIISTQEPFLDINGAFGPILRPIAAWISKQQNRIDKDRMRDASAKRGRPLVQYDPATLQQLRAKGWGLDRVARQLKISRSTANRLIKKEDAAAHVDTPNHQTSGRDEAPTSGSKTKRHGLQTKNQSIEEPNARGGPARRHTEVLGGRSSAESRSKTAPTRGAQPSTHPPTAPPKGTAKKADRTPQETKPPRR